MNLLLLNVLLAIAWSALTGNFEPASLLFGFVLGYGVLWLANRFGKPPVYFRRLPQIVEFALFFIGELVIANVRMAITVLSPRMPLRPAVIAVPLEVEDEAAIALLANLITLTPGTLSLDVTTNGKILFVHAVFLEDPERFIATIKSGYEKRVKEIFEP